MTLLRNCQNLLIHPSSLTMKMKAQGLILASDHLSGKRTRMIQWILQGRYITIKDLVPNDVKFIGLPLPFNPQGCLWLRRLPPKSILTSLIRPGRTDQDLWYPFWAPHQKPERSHPLLLVTIMETPRRLLTMKTVSSISGPARMDTVWPGWPRKEDWQVRRSLMAMPRPCTCSPASHWRATPPRSCWGSWLNVTSGLLKSLFSSTGLRIRYVTAFQ